MALNIVNMSFKYSHFYPNLLLFLVWINQKKLFIRLREIAQDKKYSQHHRYKFVKANKTTQLVNNKMIKLEDSKQLLKNYDRIVSSLLPHRITQLASSSYDKIKCKLARANSTEADVYRNVRQSSLKSYTKIASNTVTLMFNSSSEDKYPN